MWAAGRLASGPTLENHFNQVVLDFGIDFAIAKFANFDILAATGLPAETDPSFEYPGRGWLRVAELLAGSILGLIACRPNSSRRNHFFSLINFMGASARIMPEDLGLVGSEDARLVPPRQANATVADARN